MISHSTARSSARRGHAALWFLGLIVLAASVTAFAESYNGLREWAAAHRVDGVWADIWPLQVDTFIAAGELALLLSALYIWPLRVRVLAWMVSLTGLAVSVICNAGHVGDRASLADHLTAALPPIAAIAGLVIALSVIKQVSLMGAHAAEQAAEPAAVPYEEPAYEQPVYEQPVYERPYEESVYGEPAFEERPALDATPATQPQLAPVAQEQAAAGRYELAPATQPEQTPAGREEPVPARQAAPADPRTTADPLLRRYDRLFAENPA